MPPRPAQALGFSATAAVVAASLLATGAGAGPNAGAPGPAQSIQLSSTQTSGNDATPHGTLAGVPLNAPIVGAVRTPDGGGYWMAAADGGVFGFGDAGFFGSAGGLRLVEPVVGMAAAPDGRGYWMVAADGGVFTYGDAGFFGSIGGHPLNRPIVGITATPDGRGYWLVASDGGIFAFGDARFLGSRGGLPGAPVVAMAATPDGRGYWVLASDGGIFTYGDAGFFGSAANLRSPVTPVVSMAATGDGRGYWILDRDGTVWTFGDATNRGQATDFGYMTTIVPTADNGGYWVFDASGNVWSGPSTQAVQPHLPATPGESLSTAGDHSFMFPGPNNTSTARWNPCQTIRYAVNYDFAPPAAASEVATAVAQLANASGDDLVNVGTTHYLVGNLQTATSNPSWPGQADVVIAWAPGNEPYFGGGMSGWGEASWVQNAFGQQVLVRGYALLNAADSGALRPGFGFGANFEGALLLHELGHAMGLWHTGDNTQIMFPDLSSQEGPFYGVGDIVGLRQLRAGGCDAEPSGWAH